MPEVCRFDHVGVPVPMLEVDFPSGLEMDGGDVLWGPEALGESTGDTRVYSYSANVSTGSFIACYLEALGPGNWDCLSLSPWGVPHL